MNLNKSFYVETTTEGKTKIFNVGKRFFSGNCKSGGIMERFGASEAGAKNAYISQLKKDGWLPLSLEDIKNTSVNEAGIITAYPFKHRKGYMSIEKIEELARETNHVWDSPDHFTNPFSALEDYQSFVEELNEAEYDTAALRRQVYALIDKLGAIGAIVNIEDFFTRVNFIPDPRRFNKTAKELWRYYKEHLKDCCRIVTNEHYEWTEEEFEIGALIVNLLDMEPLWDLVSDLSYKAWVENLIKP